MKYVYAVLAGMASAILAAFAGAVILGILNLYLTGHNITWPGETVNWHFISLSFLDLLLLTGSSLAFVSVYILVTRKWPKKTNP